MKLADKIALITGGTSGIGLEAAKLFRNEGAHVIVTDADPMQVEAAAHQLGSGVLTLSADLRTPGELDGVFDEVRRRCDRLDILFANAGMGLAAPLEAVTEHQIDEQLAVNFKGIFFTVQKAVPLLTNGGSIVLTTSSGIKAQVPLHRFGEAGEVAKVALFLASDDASFMTGSEVVVDGGLLQV